MTELNAAGLAGIVDHTFLQSTGTRAEAEEAAAEAARLGAWSVCVSPSMLPLAGIGTGTRITAVCGFPSGKHHSSVKAAEAREAVRNGADEIDMVIDVGAVRAGDYDAVERDISAVREAVPAPTVLKVILETAALTDEQIVRCCDAAESSGADFVKTSTGFHAGWRSHSPRSRADGTHGGSAAWRQGLRRHPGLGCRSGDDRGRRHPAGAVRDRRRP